MLDNFDLGILAVWQERGDVGPVEMAQAVNLSPSQCSRRMQALRRSGHVRAVRAVLAPDKVGVGVSAYVLLTMSSHAPAAARAFHDRVREIDEIVQCQKLTGTADMIVKVETRDLASFNRLLTDQLLAAPEVATAQSSIILEDVKNTSALPLRFARSAAQ
jgi:DNA-binding Lrp family transcriptional regulator